MYWKILVFYEEALDLVLDIQCSQQNVMELNGFHSYGIHYTL